MSGIATLIEEIKNSSAFSMPKVTDPNSGRTVVNVRMWLTAAVKSGQRDSSFKH